LRAFYTVIGSVAGTPSAGTIDSQLLIATDVSGGAASGSTGGITTSGVYGFADSDGLPFSFGAPFPVVITSYLYLSVNAPDDGAPLTAAVSANFQGGAYLSAVEVYDSLGHLVPGAVITSDSGTSYPVPEPAAAAVEAIATATLTCVACSRRRARSNVAQPR
jgi:hypothetical protein